MAGSVLEGSGRASRLWAPGRPGAPGAFAQLFRHFGQGGAPNIAIVFYMYFVPGYFRAFLGTFSHTLPVVHAGCPNTDGCDGPCSKPRTQLEALPS